MKWFQHSTDSHDDPDISDAMDEFGPAGYSSFFILLEIYGREFNSIGDDGFLNLSLRFVARKLRQSSTKVQLLFNFYSKKQRIISEIKDGRVRFCVPQYLDIASNWTKRKRPTVSPDLCSTSVAPTAREKEEEEEEEKETRVRAKRVSLSKNFDQFWTQYPKKKSKGQAEKAFIAIKPDNGTMAAIMSGLEKAKESKDWAEAGGKFIPYPATWLRAKGWEDDYQIQIPQAEVKFYSDV